MAVGLSIIFGAGASVVAAGGAGIAITSSIAIVPSTTAAMFSVSFSAISLGTVMSVVSSVVSLISGIVGGGGAPQVANSGVRGKMRRESDLSHQILYGQRRIGGAVFFSGVVGSVENPRKNKFLWIGVVFGGHEFEGFGQTYLNDTRIDDDRYVNDAVFYQQFYLGSNTQAADATLLFDFPDELTTDFRLKGLAYGLFKFKYIMEPPIWVNGIPNVSVVAEGRKIGDPRNGWSASYSNNSALVLADYLMADFGLRVPREKIDENALIAAANICDEDVPLKDGGTQKRYTTDGVFDRGDKPIDVVEQLKSAMVGEVVYQKGIYFIHAGAYQAPTLHLDESYLTGPIKVETKTSGGENWNAVRGRYTTDQPPDDGTDTMPAYLNTDFVPQVNVQYQIDDNSLGPLWRDVGLAYTTDGIRAQRIAHIWLERGRMQKEIIFPANIMAIECEAWQTCTVTIDVLGITDEVYRVAEVKLLA